MNIIILGTGNVATVLARLLKKAGHTIQQVYGRNPLAARTLAGELDSSSCSNYQDLQQDADIYILAFSDTALYEPDQRLKLDGQLIVHTAGSVPANVLQNISSQYGVLYPLQSLRKELPVFSGLSLLIDGNNERSVLQLETLAASLTNRYAFANDEQRMKLHLAAVFVNNFTNHLYLEVEQFCVHEAINFKLLYPLISETAKRMETLSPESVVTGPAYRNDQVTIEKQLQLLQPYPALKNLYELFTTSIQKHYGFQDNFGAQERKV